MNPEVPPIPTLIGQQVRLRPICPQDFDSVFALMNEPAVYKGISGEPTTREQCWEKMLKIAGNWTLLGYGSWVVVDKVNHRFLGLAGLFDARRDLTPAQSVTPEVGYSFMPHAHGKGIAYESVQLALDWFDRHHAHPFTYAMINPSNLASARLAKRLGYQEDSTATYKSQPVGIWKRARVGSP